MSDLTKDPVSLEDLKRAIDEVPPCPQPGSHMTQVLYFEALYEHHDQRAEAWRTAFEWREGLDEWLETYDEGMRLIREKLK